MYNLKEDPEEWTNLAIDPGYAEKLLEMKNHIPVDRHELVNTKPLRWADVLSGKTNLYKED